MGKLLQEVTVRRRKGFTLIELLVVVAIIALLISILLPSLSRARELAKRAVCSSNLRGIGQAMYIYANDNSEFFPHDAYSQAITGTNPEDNAVTFIAQMGTNITSPTTSGTNSVNNPVSRSLFLLIIGNQCTPKQFICPSSPDSEDNLRLTISGQERASQPGINRFDFKGYPFLSYGYQVPFGRKAKPNTRLDSRMPIAADKGPYFDAGNARADSTIPDVSVTTVGLPNFGTADQILRADNDRWRPYNSRNHNGEGEQVLFVDSHVEFARKPIVGVNNDNIYTYQDPGFTFENSLIGQRPTNGKGPKTDTDTVIVP